MPQHSFRSSSRILQQLYLLRNITLLFILLMGAIALYGLGINLPVFPLSSILLIMAVVNLYTRLMIDSGREVTERLLFIQLLVEILSFSLILYFSGGATNPFTFFYLIPLAISATVIPGRATWALTLLTVALYSLLVKFYVPLSYQLHTHQMPASSGQFSQHVWGMWFGFIVSALLVSWFITHLSRELKQRDQAIADAQQRELRDQQMITLGTLAAGTAHELGTPLASLAIIAGDITEGFDPQQHPELFENQQILRGQIQRCKEILSVLSDSSGESRAESGRAMPIQEFLELIMQQWRTQYLDSHAITEFELSHPESTLIYDRTLSQAMINLLNNAADAASAPIEVIASTENGQLNINIIDNGVGLSDQQIALAGQVCFSNKPGGLGIGLFLAITTIRRCGGEVSFSRLPSGGSCTRAQLPLL